MLETYLSPVLAFARDPRVETLAGLFTKVAALVAFLFMVAAYYALPLTPVFGHDEAHYHLFYRFALTDDGRWLNYLLHEFLRRIPLPLWSLAYLTLWWLLLFRLARACVRDAAFAALAASTALVATPFVEISLWPATVVPALLLAWLAFWMQARGVAYQAIYLVSGVLMFGSIQTVYFLLPLLFLPVFLDTAQPVRERGILLFKHLCWWVAGSVAGVLVVALMLSLLIGIYFPQPAPWRNAQPVEGFASLLANVDYARVSFLRLLEELLRNGGVTWGFLLTCALAALVRVRTLFAQTPALLLLLAVLLSFFVFSIPYAPVIHIRSLLAMAAGIILGICVLVGPSVPGRVLGAILLLKLAHFYAERGQQHLETQRYETAQYLSALQELFPGYPTAFRTLALDGTMDPARPEARRFNDSSLMHPILVALGVPDVLDCRSAGLCAHLPAESAPLSVVPFAGGQLELSAAGNTGVIRYRDADTANPEYP